MRGFESLGAALALANSDGASAFCKRRNLALAPACLASPKRGRSAIARGSAVLSLRLLRSHSCSCCSGCSARAEALWHAANCSKSRPTCKTPLTRVVAESSLALLTFAKCLNAASDRDIPTDVPRTPYTTPLCKGAQPLVAFVPADRFQLILRQPDVWRQRCRCDKAKTDTEASGSSRRPCDAAAHDLRRALRGRCEEAARIKP